MRDPTKTLAECIERGEPFARTPETPFFDVQRDMFARAFSRDIDPQGVTLVAVKDGALVRCPRCKRGLLLWRHRGVDHLRLGFREFLKVHGRCGSAVREGAPVHHVPATVGV